MALRVSRRDVFSRREPAQLTAVIGKSAIYQQVGGPEIMADQLRNIVKTGELSTVTVQVLAEQDDWHPGLLGPFLLYEFPEAPTIVHLEHHRSSVFLYDDGDVDAYQNAADIVRRMAMSPTASAKLIAEVADEMERTT